MTDAASLGIPATPTSTSHCPFHEFATLPRGAPAILKDNTIFVQAPNKIYGVVEDERRRNFQALVRR
jgi:hypothetical protein